MHQVKEIKLSNGNVLEVSMKPEFLKLVADTFNVQSCENVTDDHIRMYIFGAFKSALDKAENERSITSIT